MKASKAPNSNSAIRNKIQTIEGGKFCPAPVWTPKDRVEIIQAAFRKTFQDQEFFREYKKMTGEEPTPLLPEDHEKAIREIPRDRGVIELFKKLVGAGPLPSR